MNEAAVPMGQEEQQAQSSGAVLRFIVIALTAFLTVVDLFATQAILPSLTEHYGVSPAAMGFAVNASYGSRRRLFQQLDRSPHGNSD
jgi:MFS transporter, YNFM family, putative membrane transport protein